MVQDSLLRTLELSQEIDTAAAQGDWARAADLVAARSPLLMALEPTRDAEVLDIVRTIQLLDEATTLKAREQYDALTEQKRESMRRVAAAGFYQATGRL
ncbi:flagellar protein FliT [Paraburkholderia sp. LEh10]|uniref:flagellar protein FliT n=1 Tax=Paraburkholderia sp. LEh10 TaxID=2821353 RepID=UPI001AE98733|nr:flagellar protein FliT [Paraburkholderia sp. LEh10]MBP0591186.1 flagellar protein FliT [Paraburkholderia sp. LEh10]